MVASYQHVMFVVNTDLTTNLYMYWADEVD